MTEYVKKELALSQKVGSDGSTRRDHLLSIERQSGQRLAELELPKLNFYAEQVLGWYYEVASGRQSSGFGASPLSWSEMHAWSILTGTTLSFDVVQLFRLIDNAIIESSTSERKKESDNGAKN